MNDVISISAARKQEIESILAVLSCTITSREALYVSAPITSGKRLYNSLSKGSETKEVNSINTEFIKQHNRADVTNYIKSLRSKFPILIDPTIFDIPGWTQNDYRTLWCLVIKKFVIKAVFVDDWQYSNGCCFEYLCAVRSGVETLDQKFGPLSLSYGINLIEAVIREEALRGHIDFITGVLASLKELDQQSGAI